MSPPPAKAAAVLPPLSQSRFSAMSCNFRYAHTYILDSPRAESLPALRGQRVHALISEYIRHLMVTDRRSDPDWLDGPGVLVGNAFSPDEATEVMSLFEQFAASFTIDPAKVLGTEMKITLGNDFLPVPEDYRATYEGTLDLVELADERTAVITDWKSQYAIEEAESFQAAYYPCLLLSVNPALESVTFSLRFLRYGNAARSVTFRREDLPELQDMARNARMRQRALHDALRSPSGDPQEVAAVPGSGCVYCPYLLSSCPKKETNPYAEMIPAERASFGLWLLQAKKRNDEVLKNHIKAHGPVEITDPNGVRFEAGFLGMKKRRFPLHTIWSVLMNWKDRSGEDLTPRLSVSGLSQWLRAKKRQALAADAEAVAEMQTATRFGIRKVGSDEPEENGE